MKQHIQKGVHSMEGRIETDMKILFSQTVSLSQDAYIRDSIAYTGAFILFCC